MNCTIEGGSSEHHRYVNQDVVVGFILFRVLTLHGTMWNQK
jgi:hypothetical protein